MEAVPGEGYDDVGEGVAPEELIKANVEEQQQQPPTQAAAGQEEETEAEQRERLKADIRAHNVNVSFTK